MHWQLGQALFADARNFERMTKNDEELLEEAFNAEKYGNRNEAIRLYRKVASKNSEHAAYAENCASNLEQLGVEATDKIQHPVRSDLDDSSTDHANPFQSPVVAPSYSPNEFNHAISRRTQFSAVAVRFLAVFCLMAAAYSIYRATGYYQLIDLDAGYWLVCMIQNCLMAINLLVVAWFCGNYSTALQNLLPVSEKSLDTFAKEQINLWLSITSLAVLRVVCELSFFVIRLNRLY